MGNSIKSNSITKKIDDFTEEEEIEPTYIKMDIEGAEGATLIGAQCCIEKYTPKLAICIYHKTSDLINIPLYIINGFKNKYNFYLRHHSSKNIWETVFYAIPK